MAKKEFIKIIKLVLFDDIEDGGFEYREWNDGVLLVETYKLTGCNQTYNRF